MFNILLVDDNKNTRKLMEKCFNKIRYFRQEACRPNYS